MGSKKISEQKTAAGYSLIVGAMVLVLKFYAYYLTGSQAVLSDALESIVNVVTAITVLVVIYIASKPADQDHPYGHGKVEFFSAAFEGGLIASAAIMIMFASIRAFIRGPELRQIDVGLFIITMAGIINLVLGLFLLRQGKKTKSLALEASGQHIMSDFWTSAGVIVALIIVSVTDWKWVDPLVGLLLGIQLAMTGVKLVMRSTGGLMDAEDIHLLDEILKLFHHFMKPGIIRIHYTRVIRSGDYHHIDAHVVVPEFWDVNKAHVELENFENAVINEYSHNGEIHFHVDPCRRAYCRVCDVKDCSVRKEEFKSKIPLTMEELRSPTESDEFLKARS